MMKMLLELLDQIFGILEQIKGITTNQTTILLESREVQNDELLVADMIEQMMEYKEQLITELTKLENDFDEAYKPYRGRVEGREETKLLKEKVSSILEIKNAIVEAEQNNVIIMNSLMNQKEKQLVIPKKTSEVVAAYRMQQNKP